MQRRFVRLVMRGLAVAGLAMSLGACNLVITTEPIFEASDGAGAAALKTGLWVNLDKGCEVDLASPASTWPECTNWAVVKAASLSGTSNKGEPFTVPYVLAAGDPRVMQIGIEDPESKATVYLYLGVKPLKSDSQGRITEYSGWITQCGPPPPKDAKKANGSPQFGSLNPFPGMIMDDEQSGCAPQNKAALIKAAGLSRVYDDASKNKVTRWVREGDN